METRKEVNVNCCGCAGCVETCPKNCIRMQTNQEGFYKAYFDEDLCIKCNKCVAICPMENEVKHDIKNTYAAVSKNSEYYNRSSSGGVFSHVAIKVLEKNGVVWGCAYDKNMVPTHIYIDKISQIDKLRRSKYVQSNLNGAYNKVKEQLNRNIDVLFVGTPCQISGLLLYLGKKYDNLFTIDIICHGVPSPKMFLSNIDYIKNKKGELNYYDFRLKQDKKCYAYTYTYKSGKVEVGEYYKDVYFNEFYDMTSLNENCYKCPYSCIERTGDLTIGDFGWGVQHHDIFKNYEDISCILVNTNNGKIMLEDIKEDMILEETKLEYILERNKNLLRPTIRPSYRNNIYGEINKKGYKKWANDYYHSIRYYKKTPLLKPLVKLKMFINNMIK